MPYQSRASSAGKAVGILILLLLIGVGIIVLVFFVDVESFFGEELGINMPGTVSYDLFPSIGDESTISQVPLQAVPGWKAVGSSVSILSRSPTAIGIIPANEPFAFIGNTKKSDGSYSPNVYYFQIQASKKVVMSASFVKPLLDMAFPSIPPPKPQIGSSAFMGFDFVDSTNLTIFSFGITTNNTKENVGVGTTYMANSARWFVFKDGVRAADIGEARYTARTISFTFNNGQMTLTINPSSKFTGEQTSFTIDGFRTVPVTAVRFKALNIDYGLTVFDVTLRATV